MESAEDVHVLLVDFSFLVPYLNWQTTAKVSQHLHSHKRRRKNLAPGHNNDSTPSKAVARVLWQRVDKFLPLQPAMISLRQRRIPELDGPAFEPDVLKVLIAYWRAIFKSRGQDCRENANDRKFN